MSTKNGSFVFRLFSVLVLLTLLFSALGVTPAYATAIRYAKPAASGTGDCLSWANACTLQTALTSAASGEEIWAAAGTHKPTTGVDRTATFQLKGGVAVYGGFAGTETAHTQRNPAANLTILSGDIGTVSDNSDNSYHVVIGETGATLDGFTITAGNAAAGFGGGMYNGYGSSPTLTNVTFSGNAADSGGGMSNHVNACPTLTNVTFKGNSATNGGGMSNDPDSCPTLTNVTFSANTATNLGGGMYNWNSSPSLTNVTFSANAAINGGGMHNFSSSPTLTNVTFSGNTATNLGGGMYSYSSSSPTIRNTIFWDNTATNGGAQIYNNSSTSVVNDSVVQGGCPDGSTCTHIISTDPLLGTLGDYGGFTQTIPLLAGSSAIDTGNDAVCPATDQRGVTRPQGAHCDIGSFELVRIFLPLILR